MATPIILPRGNCIGFGHAAYIIADVGFAHEGSLERALRLIRLAKQSGANAAAFHSFEVDRLFHLPQSAANKELSLWEAHQFPVEWHEKLMEASLEAGIDLLCVPYDLDRLQSLIDHKVPLLQLALGDFDYNAMLNAAGESGIPTVLPTAGADSAEITEALNQFQNSGGSDLVLLYSHLQSPTPYQEVNLRALLSLFQAHPHLIGFCDSSPRGIASLAAVAIGACLIVKPLNDQADYHGGVALNSSLFSHMVAQIRQLENLLGIFELDPALDEAQEVQRFRRGLYSTRKIEEGEALSRENVRLLRGLSQEGISASQAESALGKKARKEIPAHTLITWEHLE